MSRAIGHARAQKFLEALASVDDRRLHSEDSHTDVNPCYTATMSDRNQGSLNHPTARALATDFDSSGGERKDLETAKDIELERKSKRALSSSYPNEGKSALSSRRGRPKKTTAAPPLRASSKKRVSKSNGKTAAETPSLRPAYRALSGDVVELPQYRPLGSVWIGEDDAELLEQLLRFYPRERPRDILDATINGGRFWRGSKRKVIGLDIDPKHRPAVVADNTAMPFRDGTFDVVVYDPPHIPNQGRDRSKDFNKRFGLGERSTKEHGYTFAHTYPPFLREAYRVLRDEGILFAKIVDYVHNHRYQWAHVELITAGQAVGFTACDCIIKVRKGPIIDPKWKVAHHTRRQHSYWIIFRKSHKCE